MAGRRRRSPDGWFARLIAASSRALTSESDRWFLWLPVLFANGILLYFARSSEPDPTLSIALLIGAIGLALALKQNPLGFAVAGALLTLAAGFATAKLHTELARAPVLDNAGCIGKVKGKTIALVRQHSALEEDCRLADIVVAPLTVTKACRAARVVVDRKMLKEHGAYALYIEGLSIRSETVAEARGSRPWVPEHAPPCRHQISASATPSHMVTEAKVTMMTSDQTPNLEGNQYRRIRPTSRPCTRTRSGPKMRVS